MEGESILVRSELIERVRGTGADETWFIEQAVERALADVEFDRLIAEVSTDLGPTPESLNAEAEALWHAG